MSQPGASGQHSPVMPAARQQRPETCSLGVPGEVQPSIEGSSLDTHPGGAGGPWGKPLAPTSRPPPHLNHTNQEAQADGKEHEDEQEAGDQVG